MHVTFQVRQPGHLAKTESGGDLAGSRPGDRFQLRQDVHGPAGGAGAHGRGNGVQVLRVGPVHHDRQERAAFGEEFLPGNLDGVGRLRDRAPLRAHHGHDGGGQVVREACVEVEFDGGILAGKVGPLHNHHIAVA